MSLARRSPIARPRGTFLSRLRHSHAFSPAQIQPFVRFARLNCSRINTSENFSTSRIFLICLDFNSTEINTSGNKDLRSNYFNTSGAKDLKSRRINTSEKQGRGWGTALLRGF
jgi:hypothetical protein